MSEKSMVIKYLEVAAKNLDQDQEVIRKQILNALKLIHMHWNNIYQESYVINISDRD